MAWHQSHMFSSTAQILEVYLEASPIPSENGSLVMKWTPTKIVSTTEKVAGDKTQNYTSYPSPKSSDTTPRTSLTDGSAASSPASSHTAYSSSGRSPKKSVSSEIRRRRLPEGVEPRAKNLSLTKSNGATKLLPPPILDAALTAASSNYSQSPPMESPVHLPPPPSPPPKAAGRSVQRKPITRKPLQMNQEIQQSPSTLPEAVDILSMGDKNPFSRNYEQAGNASNITSPQRSELPPRSTSLLSNSQKPVVGRRPVPAHKKTLSTASSNKDLPPDPPINRALLPQRQMSNNMSTSTPEKLRQKAATISNNGSVHVHSRSNSSAELRSLPLGLIGLPAGPKSQAAIPVSRRPIPVKQNSMDQVVEPVKKPLTRGGPALGSLSSGPRPKPKPQHQVTASTLSLTSSTVSGPIPLPDFQAHRRADSDINKSSLRTHSRERSRSRASSEEMITIAMDPRPVETHRPTPSQASVRSEPSQVSRSTTPHSQRSASTAATSISSLPGVPEVRTPLIAPEIKPTHFTCYTQHRPLVASSNHLTPILCMTCKQDSEKMWGCGWCHLRICTGCKDALVEVKNDLKKMLDEAKAGTLIVGKERIPMPPFMGENGPRKYGSDTSSVRSYNSAGSRGMYPRGAGPRPGFAPIQPPYLRQERSMEALQSQGSGRGPYGPPMHHRGAAPTQMHSQPLDYIGMPPINARPRQPMPPRSKPSTAPQSPQTITPTFGPVSLGFQTNTQKPIYPNNHFQQHRPHPGNQSRRQGPPPPRSRYDDDGIMPPMLDLSLDAGAGPMAAGLRGLNLGGGAPRQMNPFATGHGPYPPPPLPPAAPRARGMA